MRHFYFIICLFFISNYWAQTLYTFANTTSVSIAASGSSSISVSVSGVPTTGMVLRQVNIGFGSTATTNSGNVNAITMRLRDALGNMSTMLSPTSFGGAVGDFRLFDIHLRDNSVLKTPDGQKTATGSVLSKGYPFHYGYYKPEGSFSGFNTTGSVNGTWQFVINNGATGARVFTKIELVFGPAIVGTDIRVSKPNQSCATHQCIDASKVFYATNNGYPTNQTVTPPNTVSGCAWNGAKDNNNWFFFEATGSTAYVSISGFSTVQESSVFMTSACSAAATYTVVTGGCGPSDMFTGGFHAQKYNTTTTGATYASGYAWNHGYYLTGLVTGNRYIFVIDGSGAAVSDFYVELTGNALSCSLVLPVDIEYFKGENTKEANILKWATASEENHAYFELEKSLDGLNFKTLSTFNKQEDNISKKHLTYQHRDEACNAYYRLKQYDYNGAFKYHNTVYLENDIENIVPQVFPNPANNSLTISYTAKTNTPTMITLLDISGREILRETAVFNPDNKEIKLNIENLQNGLYFVRIDNGFKSFQKKIVKE